MTIHITSTCNVAKTFSVKREKQDDDTEVVTAHLKVADVLIDRDQLDEFLRQPIGWSCGALFDELGAPRARLTLSIAKSNWTATGVIKGGEKSTDPLLRLKEADVAGLSFDLTKLGALLSCQLSWIAAGDEVDDIADMLGQLCSVDLVVQDGGQADLVDAVRDLQRHAERTGTVTTITASDGEDVTFAPAAGRITSAGQVILKLQNGFHLRGADPDYWIERPDGSERQGVWLNAARSALKRGLVPIGDDAAGDEVGRWKWRDAA